MPNNQERRDFIKKATLGLGAVALQPSITLAENDANSLEAPKNKPIKINILQTTDVHCQIHAHDELFWENDKAVFRKTGGYA